jgi:hypothetical protein
MPRRTPPAPAKVGAGNRDAGGFAASGQEAGGGDRGRTAAQVQRGAHHVMRWLGFVAAGLILAAGLLLWRLTQGPIALDGLAPWVEAAVARAAPGWHVAIAGVRVGIDRRTHQLDLRLTGVRVAREGGEPLAAFPEAAASFSLKGLLLGRLEPTRLVVERPVLRLVREADGAVQFHFGSEAPGASGLAAQQGLSAIESLREVAVRDATLIFDDRQGGQVWRADRVAATAFRIRSGVKGDVSLAVPIGGRTPELHAGYRYDVAAHMLDLSLYVGPVAPAALAPLEPRLAVLRAIDLPVSGTLETRIDLDKRAPLGFRVDLGLGQGKIETPFLPDGVLAVRQGELHAIYAPETAALRLVRAQLDLGGGTWVAVKGELQGLTSALIASGGAAPAAPLAASLGIVLDNVPLARVEKLWPPSVATGGRRWVLEHVQAGVLDEASFHLGLDVGAAAGSVAVTSQRGAIRFHDLAVDYFDGLPPARNASGSATLSGQRLQFTPTGGTIKAIAITGGSVVLTDLDAPTQFLSLDLSLKGPIRDALEVINSKRFDYLRQVGLDPAQVSGQAESRVHLKLPLVDGLTFDRIDFTVKSKLSAAAINDIAFGHGLSDGQFAVDVTRPGVHLQGTARFDGVPSRLDGNVGFGPRAAPRARYHIALVLDDAERRRLGLDYLADRIAGPVGVDLTYSDFGDGRAEGAAAFDLRRARLSVAEAGWQKPEDVPATANLAFDLQGGRVTRLPAIAVTAPGLDARFAAGLQPDGKGLAAIDIRRLAIGDSDVHGRLTRRREGGWHVDLAGPALDVAGLVKNALGPASAGKPAENPPPLAIDLRLDRLILGPRRELRGLVAALLREAGQWRTARVDARFTNGRGLSLRLGGGAVSYRSDDLGASLKLLDVTGNVVGGKVTVSGRVAKDGALQGHVDGSGYHLVGAPVFAKVLSLASLPAAASLLRGAGIPFSTLRGDFTWRQGQLAIQRLLAYGGAIGATAAGTVDLSQDRLDLQGTIVPAYTLNSILGNVPVLGSLLLGGEGQGLFAANYHVQGSAADPQVSVNPLSVLTPGFLRRLLQPNFGLPPAEAAPAAPAEPPSAGEE